VENHIPKLADIYSFGIIMSFCIDYGNRFGVAADIESLIGEFDDDRCCWY